MFFREFFFREDSIFPEAFWFWEGGWVGNLGFCFGALLVASSDKFLLVETLLLEASSCV
jgi:hypothetical protein